MKFVLTFAAFALALGLSAVAVPQSAEAQSVYEKCKARHAPPGNYSQQQREAAAARIKACVANKGKG